MAKLPRPLHPDAPLTGLDHGFPTSRREFLGRGLLGGAGMAVGGLLGLFADPRLAQAALSSDLQDLKEDCGLTGLSGRMIPFICFDLAGGASIAGSNVLVGGPGGQHDHLTTAGYSKLGLPGDRIPSLTGQTDETLGLAFHSDSAFLRGILEKVSAGTASLVDGAVIPARSENDTGNNPHNPMYGIYRCGANGELLSLIGSSSSVSGGNSVAPIAMIDAAARPTKVDRPSDVTGLVDTGKLTQMLGKQDAVAVMESIHRLSDHKLAQVRTGVADDAAIKQLVRCGYLKTADLVDRFGNPADLNPALDPDIVGPIFTAAEMNDGEFRKTASVMKMVIEGYAGAGTISMGGFDYHTGERATGELRDLRAGRCIGACLEYAARKGVPLMIYVFSDGSLSSNGMIDDSENGRGKLVWTGDNQGTAASFFLVYNPNGRPALLRPGQRQIGHFRPNGDVETASSPAANNVNQLVETVLLNYLALHGREGEFANKELFPNHGLGSAGNRDKLMVFGSIVSGGL